MASGDSRRPSKGKKYSSDHSTQDEDFQWLSSSNTLATNTENGSTKTRRRVNSQNFPNVRFLNPSVEESIHEEDSKRMSEEGFSRDTSQLQSMSPSDFSATEPYPPYDELMKYVVSEHCSFYQQDSKPTSRDYFQNPMRSNQGNSENNNMLKKEDYKKSPVVIKKHTDRNVAEKINHSNERKHFDDKVALNAVDPETHKNAGHYPPRWLLARKKLKDKVEEKKIINEDSDKKLRVNESPIITETSNSTQHGSRFEQSDLQSRSQQVDGKKRVAVISKCNTLPNLGGTSILTTENSDFFLFNN